MDRGTALFPAYRTNAFTQGIRDVFGEVAALLFGQSQLAPRRAIEDELRALVAPHLAILIHKRGRYLSPADDGSVRHERWAKELDDFVSRTFFWPMPATTEAYGKLARWEIAAMVECIVAEEQVAAMAPVELPATSRFGSSWAD